MLEKIADTIGAPDVGVPAPAPVIGTCAHAGASHRLSSRAISARMGLSQS